MGRCIIELVSIGSQEETLAAVKHGTIDPRLINDAISDFKIKKNKATMEINYRLLKNYAGIEVYHLIQYLVDSRACFTHGKTMLFRMCPDAEVTVSASSSHNKISQVPDAVVELHFKLVPFLLDHVC